MYDFVSIRRTIEECQCPPYVFYFACIQCNRAFSTGDGLPPVTCEDRNHAWYLQARLWRKDVDTGEEGWGHGGKYFISPFMTEGEIVKRCLVAARDYSEHEVREAFLWRGRRIFGPHVSIQRLWEVADELEIRTPHAIIAEKKTDDFDEAQWDKCEQIVNQIFAKDIICGYPYEGDVFTVIKRLAEHKLVDLDAILKGLGVILPKRSGS